MFRSFATTGLPRDHIALVFMELYETDLVCLDADIREKCRYCTHVTLVNVGNVLTSLSGNESYMKGKNRAETDNDLRVSVTCFFARFIMSPESSLLNL